MIIQACDICSIILFCALLWWGKDLQPHTNGIIYHKNVQNKLEKHGHFIDDFFMWMLVMIVFGIGYVIISNFSLLSVHPIKLLLPLILIVPVMNMLISSRLLKRSLYRSFVKIHHHMWIHLIVWSAINGTIMFMLV